jgi:Fe-S-cluster-containing hydrogenase component 2
VKKERSGKGRRYLVIDCREPIPCNPCEEVCGKGAVMIEGGLNSPPVLREESCDGCGACINVCPGSCIYLVEEGGGGRARVTMAHDRLPVPIEGSEVDLVGAGGEALGQGIVYRVKNTKADRHLRQVTVEAPAEMAGVVRGFRMIEDSEERRPAERTGLPPEEDFLVCRCEEVPYSEIARVVSMGVRHAPNLRRFTRTGLGLCQGKACTETLLNNLSGLTGLEIEELGFPRARPPVRPVSLGELGG